MRDAAVAAAADRRRAPTRAACRRRAITPSGRRRRRRSPVVRPSPPRRRAARAAASVHSRALFEQPMAADDARRAPSDGRLGAASGQRLEVLDRRQRHAASARACDDGRADRMLGARSSDAASCSSRPPRTAHRRLRRAPSSGTSTTQLSGRQRAGLVERDAAHGRQPLERGAALDQHALARRRGQRRHDRDRRRDDERARARDHQQHERAVDPRTPDCAPQQSGGTSATIAASASTAGVYNAREPLDERLARRALRLRALDEMDDARQRRIARAAASTRTSRGAPRPLIVPAKTSSPGDFVHRQRFAGHRRLVDVARHPPRRAPSSGIFSPGAHDHRRRPRGCRPPPRAASIGMRRIADERLGRRQVHQRADRRPRARSIARASSSCASANRNDDGGAFDHCPSTIAPATATSISTLMSSASERARAARAARRRSRRWRSRARTRRRTMRRSTPASSSAMPAAGQQASRARRTAAGVAADGAGADRLLVLEPRAHARLRDRFGDRRRARASPRRI